MRDLGTLGGNNSGAWGVNNHRQLVGYSYLSGESVYHAFLWTSSGGMQDLGTLGGSYSVAAAISDSGAVVGSSTLPGDAVQHAFGPRVGACRIWELWEVPIPRPVASTNQAKLWAGLISHWSRWWILMEEWKGNGEAESSDPARFRLAARWGASINNVGQIAGTGYVKGLPNGNNGRAYLLTPTG